MSEASRASRSSVSVSGDEHALEELYARYQPPLQRYLVRLTGDWDMANDVAQEAFIRLLDHRPPPDAARPWLFRVATNLVRDAARRSSRRRTLVLDGRAALAHGDAPRPPDSDVQRDEARRIVRTALEALSDKERQALLMREEGFAHREIAAALGTTTGSIGTLLRRALAKAAAQLAPAGEGGP